MSGGPAGGARMVRWLPPGLSPMGLAACMAAEGLDVTCTLARTDGQARQEARVVPKGDTTGQQVDAWLAAGLLNEQTRKRWYLHSSLEIEDAGTSAPGGGEQSAWGGWAGKCVETMPTGLQLRLPRLGRDMSYLGDAQQWDDWGRTSPYNGFKGNPYPSPEGTVLRGQVVNWLPRGNCGFVAAEDHGGEIWFGRSALPKGLQNFELWEGASVVGLRVVGLVEHRTSGTEVGRRWFRWTRAVPLPDECLMNGPAPFRGGAGVSADVRQGQLDQLRRLGGQIWASELKEAESCALQGLALLGQGGSQIAQHPDLVLDEDSDVCRAAGLMPFPGGPEEEVGGEDGGEGRRPEWGYQNRRPMGQGAGQGLQALGPPDRHTTGGGAAATGGRGKGNREEVHGWARGAPISRKDKELQRDGQHLYVFERNRGLAGHGAWARGTISGWSPIKGTDGRKIGFVDLGDGGSEVQFDRRNLSDGLQERADGPLRGIAVAVRLWYGDGGYGKRWGDLVRTVDEDDEAHEMGEDAEAT